MNVSPQSAGGTIVEETPDEALFAATEPYFDNEIEEEVGANPTTTQLAHFLKKEAFQGGAMEMLSAEYLTRAVTLWLFCPGEGKGKKVERAPSNLPNHRLRRVLERMRDLRGNLDLETLAMESGYSRSHFLRMFRASTGCTPHRYLLQLRLERAKELMQEKNMSLIDIAAMCGFSSHAHLSKMFRQIVGMPPSEFRRNL